LSSRAPATAFFCLDFIPAFCHLASLQYIFQITTRMILSIWLSDYITLLIKYVNDLPLLLLLFYPYSLWGPVRSSSAYFPASSHIHPTFLLDLNDTEFLSAFLIQVWSHLGLFEYVIPLSHLFPK
jgi:hypothetical protein